jgi:hypothetical protein
VQLTAQWVSILKRIFLPHAGKTIKFLENSSRLLAFRKWIRGFHNLVRDILALNKLENRPQSLYMLFSNILLVKPVNSTVLGPLKSHWLRILLFLIPVFCSCEWSNTLTLSYQTDNCILPYHFSIHLNQSPWRGRQYVPLKHPNI